MTVQLITRKIQYVYKQDPARLCVWVISLNTIFFKNSNPQKYFSYIHECIIQYFLIDVKIFSFVLLLLKDSSFVS